MGIQNILRPMLLPMAYLVGGWSYMVVITADKGMRELPRAFPLLCSCCIRL